MGVYNINFDNLRSKGNESINEVLTFLENRFNSENYRGIVVSQHNRWNFKKFNTYMNELKKYTDKFLKIPPGDFNKDNLKDNNYMDTFIDYYNFVNSISVQGDAKGTFNSIKKNIFPDLARGYVINRFIKRENFYEVIKPFSRQRVDAIKATDFVIKYFSLESEAKKENEYTNFIKNLISPIYTSLIECIKLLDNKMFKGEFLLFFTAIDLNSSYDYERIANLILKYRKFENSAKFIIIYNLSTIMDPKLAKDLPKNLKKDWHNFKNETDQIWSMLETGNIFSFKTSDKNDLDDCIFYNIDQFNKKETRSKFKARRSNVPKNDYLKKHKTNDTSNYEFDHIIPFSFAKDFSESTKIDYWKNLILINPDSHSKKTRSNNRYMKLEKSSDFSNDKILKLVSIYDEDDFISLNFGKEYSCNLDLIDVLIEYNKMLLDEILYADSES